MIDRRYILLLSFMLAGVWLDDTAGALAFSQSVQSWEQLQRAGTDALDANQYWIAEPTLKQAVIKAGSFGDADIRLAKSLGELGRLYTIRGRFDEAEPYLEEELRIKEQALGTADGQTIPDMGALVKFYLKYGTASKADPLTEQILSFLTGKLKEPESLTKGRKKWHKGMPLEGWAGEADPGHRDPAIEWAITCDDLGELYRLNGNYDMAERLFKAALDVKSTVLGKEHLSLANSYDSLGTLCQERGDNAGAAIYFKDSLAMTERILSPDNPKVYQRLDKLAKCLVKCGKVKDAEELYQRAQTFWKNADSPSADQVRAMYSLGSLYAEEKNYEAAEPVLKKAAEMAEEVFGPDSVGLVPYLQRYAYVLYYLGRKPEVEQLRARANMISGVM